MKFTVSRIKRTVLEVMNKPSTPTDIMCKMNLSRNCNLSTILRQLCRLKLMRCMNSISRTGRVYGLTHKGIGIRKKICDKNKLTPYIEPEINWPLYGWVISGRQKKAILLGIKQQFLPLKYIRENARNYDPRISRMNAHDIIQLFVKKRIVRRTMQNDRIIYSLTKKGETLRSQLFKP